MWEKINSTLHHAACDWHSYTIHCSPLMTTARIWRVYEVSFSCYLYKFMQLASAYSIVWHQSLRNYNKFIIIIWRWYFWRIKSSIPLGDILDPHVMYASSIYLWMCLYRTFYSNLQGDVLSKLIQVDLEEKDGFLRVCDHFWNSGHLQLKAHCGCESQHSYSICIFIFGICKWVLHIQRIKKFGLLNC